MISMRGEKSNSGKIRRFVGVTWRTPVFIKVLKWEEIRWDLR